MMDYQYEIEYQATSPSAATANILFGIEFQVYRIVGFHIFIVIFLII